MCFARDHLPPSDLLPDFDFSGPAELVSYGDHINVATELLDNIVENGFGNNNVVHLSETSWTYFELLD